MSKLRSFLRDEPEWRGKGNRVLIIMVGLPRSGKSTFAKYTGAPIVSRDGIRKAIGCYPFVQNAENFVTMMETYMVRSLFESGHTSVVVDACHVRKSQRTRWKSKEWKRIFFVMQADRIECRKRAVATNQEYLLSIIDRMDKYYQPVTEKEREEG